MAWMWHRARRRHSCAVCVASIRPAFPEPPLLQVVFYRRFRQRRPRPLPQQHASLEELTEPAPLFLVVPHSPSPLSCRWHHYSKQLLSLSLLCTGRASRFQVDCRRAIVTDSRACRAPLSSRRGHCRFGGRDGLGRPLACAGNVTARCTGSSNSHGGRGGQGRRSGSSCGQRPATNLVRDLPLLAFVKCRVPSVLHLVVGPPLETTSNLCPLVPKLTVCLHHDLVLICAPVLLVDVWLQVVVPPFTALLPIPPWEGVGDDRPACCLEDQDVVAKNFVFCT
mmetsp:Transcript_23453/g.47801  ORF Transcript_23453/g.47801 Transcript_23453/m.47801 type:complete len:280 (+) Transcript_23453:295-1134(+)